MRKHNPLPLLQNVARSHPPGGDALYPFPTVTSKRRGPAARASVYVSHETIRFWWNRFDPPFEAEIRRKLVDRMRIGTHWRWHLDKVFVKINGEMDYLWRALDHEGEVFES